MNFLNRGPYAGDFSPDQRGHIPPRPLPPIWSVPAEEPVGHKLNADQTVAVATDVFWNEDMATAPRGTKCQLLGAGGVATYGVYNGDPFWIGWCPLPKRRKL